MRIKGFPELYALYMAFKLGYNQQEHKMGF